MKRKRVLMLSTLVMLGCGMRQPTSPLDVEHGAMLVGEWQLAIENGYLTRLSLRADGTAHREAIEAASGQRYGVVDGTWRVENGSLDLRLYSNDKANIDGNEGEPDSIAGPFFIDDETLLFPALLSVSAGSDEKVFEATHVYANYSLTCQTQVTTTVKRKIELRADNSSTLSTDDSATTCYTNLPPSETELSYASVSANFDSRFEIITFRNDIGYPIADTLTVLPGKASSLSPRYTRPQREQ